MSEAIHLHASLARPLPQLVTRPVPIQAPRTLPDRRVRPEKPYWSRTYRHYTLARHWTNRRAVAVMLMVLRSLALREGTWRGNAQWEIIVHHLPGWICNDHACMQRYLYDPIQRMAYKRRRAAHPELY